MSQATHRFGQIARSIFAVVAGFAAVVVLSTGTDFALEKTVFPTLATPNAGDPLFLLALTYRSAYSAAGGYLTARLAPGTPVRHVFILAAIGLAAGIAGVIATSGMNLGPRWYPIAVAVTGPLFIVVGGLFHRRNSG